LTGWSLFVHYRGANAVQVLDWNYAPAGVDVYPARVWDWRDAQFLRGVTWGDPIHLAVSGLLPYQVPDPDFFARAGGNDVRTRRFDAAHSLIAPPDDTWIAIATYQTVAKPLAGLFTQTAPSITTHTIAESQPYRLYHFDLGDRLARAAQASEQTAAWSLNFDLSTADIHSARMPVQFGQAIELLGYDLSTDSAQENVTLITYWQVINRVAHPLRLFVHALNPVGQTVAQVDRWDTPPRFWQPGDLIAQISQFTLSLDMRPVWVEMGLYNPDSGDRLPVIVDDREVDHRLLLKQIKAP
jgi:hypothetical protein